MSLQTLNRWTAVGVVLIALVVSNPGTTAGRGQKRWQNLNPQFYGRSDGLLLNHNVVVSSAYFSDEYTGWVVGTNGGWLGQSRGMVAGTRDGGKTWHVEFHANSSEFSDIAFLSDDRGWVVGSEQSKENRAVGVLLETNNGGINWHRRTLGNFAASDFSSIYFSDQERGYIVGGANVRGRSNSVIYRTSNGGRTWELAYLGESKGSLRDVKFDKSSQVGWAVGDEGEILHSKDGGRSWQKQDADFDSLLLGVTVVDQNEVWIAASDSALLHTTDGGATWKVVSPELPADTLDGSALWFSGIFFEDRNNGWVCGSSGIILNTRDRGRSWQLEASGEGDFLYKIVRVNRSILAISKDASIFRRSL